MAIHPLYYIQVDLQQTVSAVCKHLLNKSFDTEENERNGMIMLVESQMMTDEVSHFISHHEHVEKALVAYLSGESLTNSLDNEPRASIYDHCLHYFEGVNCPLGSSTLMLTQWVGNYVERVQSLQQAYEQLYGKPDAITEADEQGEPRYYMATDSEKFSHNSSDYLRLIEQSHALSDYNERVLRVRTMLMIQQPVDAILNLMQLNQG